MDETPDASTIDGTRAPRPTRKWTPTPPKSAVGLAWVAVAVAALVLLAAMATAGSVRAALAELGARTDWADVGLYGFAATALFLFAPAVKGLQTAIQARRLLRIDLADARAATADALEKAKLAIGYSVAFVMVLAFGHFLIANEIAVGRTFFDVGLISETFHLVGKAFWVNVEIFMIAEVLVLVWGLLIAVARLAPGRAGAPVRLIATAYVDLFRGLPAIIAIYLVGFGLPLTDLPILRDMTPTMFAILALTLTYGAYVSEVYRSGIESVHWSQTAAARSLGFSHTQTLRFVVVPQAVRRIIPPLLNDFISLQKDTALVSVIGTVDAFNQAKIIASNHFNLSSVTTVAFLFVLITIPQARLVDRLIERDQKRMRAGG
jgi:polar amino acid transport system permease protein